MDKKEQFLEAMRFRHACKIFDESKKISDEDFGFILEAGRLSPSSFGMEPWRFLVIEDGNLRRDLKPLCWDQAQITTSSKLLVIKTLKSDLAKDTQYIKDMLSRRHHLSAGHIEAYVKKYGDYITEHTEFESLASWGGKQCYIAGANMMSAAAFIGIDSCAIEGFDKRAVESLLKIDTDTEELSLMIVFGYRIKGAPTKVRLPLSSLVQTI